MAALTHVVRKTEKVLGQTLQDVLNDLSSVRWSRSGLFLLASAVVVGFIAVTVWASLFSFNSSGDRSLRICGLGDKFDLYANFYRYDMWQISNFFQVTLPFGSLSFTQAKVIDITWDVVSARSNMLPFAALDR